MSSAEEKAPKLAATGARAPVTGVALDSAIIETLNQSDLLSALQGGFDRHAIRVGGAKGAPIDLGTRTVVSVHRVVKRRSSYVFDGSGSSKIQVVAVTAHSSRWRELARGFDTTAAELAGSGGGLSRVSLEFEEMRLLLRLVRTAEDAAKHGTGLGNPGSEPNALDLRVHKFNVDDSNLSFTLRETWPLSSLVRVDGDMRVEVGARAPNDGTTRGAGPRALATVPVALAASSAVLQEEGRKSNRASRKEKKEKKKKKKTKNKGGLKSLFSRGLEMMGSTRVGRGRRGGGVEEWRSGTRSSRARNNGSSSSSSSSSNSSDVSPNGSGSRSSGHTNSTSNRSYRNNRMVDGGGSSGIRGAGDRHHHQGFGIGTRVVLSFSSSSGGVSVLTTAHEWRSPSPLAAARLVFTLLFLSRRFVAHGSANDEPVELSSYDLRTLGFLARRHSFARSCSLIEMMERCMVRRELTDDGARSLAAAAAAAAAVEEEVGARKEEGEEGERGGGGGGGGGGEQRLVEQQCFLPRTSRYLTQKLEKARAYCGCTSSSLSLSQHLILC